MDCLPPDGDSESYVCVKPRYPEKKDGKEPEQLVRLEIENPREGEGSRVIVYRGPASEVLDHIHLGYLLPPSLFPFTLALALVDAISTKIPEAVTLFGEYLAMLNLSLAGFNLLPIAGLDGGVICCLAIAYLFSGEDRELDRSERGESEVVRTRWKQDRVERFVSFFFMGCAGIAGIGTVWRDFG